MTSEPRFGGMDIETMAHFRVADAPIKLLRDEPTLTLQQLEAHGAAVREHLVPANPNLPGTCIDERVRVGVLSGEAIIEPRESAPGGPDIYGLYVVTGLGTYRNSPLSAKERLAAVKSRNNAQGIPSGGHANCAANAKFALVVAGIAAAPPEMIAYAKTNLGDAYDQSAMDTVVDNYAAEAQAGTFNDWDETVYLSVLGDEAQYAIEKLADVPHEARTIVRNHIRGYTVNQTALHNDTGEDSFDNDEDYTRRIEAALATGPDPERAAVIARHVREAVLATIALGGVPNQELHQIDLVI